MLVVKYYTSIFLLSYNTKILFCFRLRKGKVLAKEEDLKEVQRDISLIKSMAGMLKLYFLMFYHYFILKLMNCTNNVVSVFFKENNNTVEALFYIFQRITKKKWCKSW